MRVVVVTPPAGPVVTTDQAKDHLDVFDASDDALIAAYVAAATANLDGPEGWLGRALGRQTLELRLDGFHRGPMVLPCPPIVEIDSVKYVDVDGIEQTLDPGVYELLGTELDRAFDQHWPRPRRQRESVRIRYLAGYETLHPSIFAAILLMVSDLYANRETVVAGLRAAATEIPMSMTLERLLTPLRVW